MKTQTTESSRRKSFKTWIKKKFLDKAREAIKQQKFRGVKETQEQGIERTRRLETAQAVFDAIREIHDAL